MDPFIRKLALGPGLAVALLLSPAVGRAAPVVSLNWDSCTGPVDKAPLAGTSCTLLASAIGVDQPHRGYYIAIAYGDAARGVPDAWRFDPIGCQPAGMYSIRLSFQAKAPPPTCLHFHGTAPTIRLATSLGLYPPDRGYPTTLMIADAWHEYQPGIAPHDPNQRYLLAQFRFDHLFSAPGPTDPQTNCGGLDTPVCFIASEGFYMTTGGAGDVSFVGLGGGVVATANGASACGPVPVRRGTWGQIKGQYR